MPANNEYYRKNEENKEKYQSKAIAPSTWGAVGEKLTIMLNTTNLDYEKVFLISDNRLLSEYLSEHISQMLAIEVVTERSSIIFDGGLKKVNAAVPLIVDTGSYISRIKKDYWKFVKDIKQCQTIFIADEIDVDLVHNLIEINARALIPTRFNKRLFTSALFLALQGEKYFPSEVWLPGLRRKAKGVSDLSLYKTNITKREYEVLEQLCEGSSNKIIAHHLGLSESTIKMHLVTLSRKLKADNRTKLVCNALQSGFFRNNSIACPSDNIACPYSDVFEGDSDDLDIPHSASNIAGLAKDT